MRQFFVYRCNMSRFCVIVDGDTGKSVILTAKPKSSLLKHQAVALTSPMIHRPDDLIDSQWKKCDCCSVMAVIEVDGMALNYKEVT